MKQELLPTAANEHPRRGLLVHNGDYEIAHPRRGRFTAKIGTAQGGEFRGRRLVYLLVGPDPVRDYRAVGEIVERDLDAAVDVWPQYRGPDSRQPIDGWHYQLSPGWSSHEQKLAILLDLAVRKLAPERAHDSSAVTSHFAAEGYAVRLASRCARCNRLLESPESLASGYGPECAAAAGGGK